MGGMNEPRGYLRRAIDETGVGVLLEAQEATWRAAYGDETVDEALRRYGEQLVRDIKRK